LGGRNIREKWTGESLSDILCIVKCDGASRRKEEEEFSPSGGLGGSHHPGGGPRPRGSRVILFGLRRKL